MNDVLALILPAFWIGSVVGTVEELAVVETLGIDGANATAAGGPVNVVDGVVSASAGRESVGTG